MVGASLAARRAEPTSCQHPFPSCGFDPFVKPQGNDRNSRDADGRSRSKADVADRGLGRLKWADSAPTRVASGRTGMRAKAAIPLRERTSLHRPPPKSIISAVPEYRCAPSCR